MSFHRSVLRPLVAVTVAVGVVLYAASPDPFGAEPVAPAIVAMVDAVAQGVGDLMDMGVTAAMVGAFIVAGPAVLMMIYLLGVGHLPTRPERAPDEVPPVSTFSRRMPPIARQALARAGASRAGRQAG